MRKKFKELLSKEFKEVSRRASLVSEMLMSSPAPAFYKEIFRRLTVIIAVLISGLGLSLLFVVRISVADLLMLLAAPIVAVVFLPRRDWLRVGAFVFLVASVYGIGRIAAEVARSTLDQTPMLSSWNQYGVEGLVYLFYGFIWLIWWWGNRTNARKG